MRRLLKPALLSCLLLMIFSSKAFAHGTVIYVSTPIVPPLQWIWLAFIFFIISMAWDYRTLKTHAGTGKIVIIGICTILSLIGLHMNLMPFTFAMGPPTPSFVPFRVFYGLKWEAIGTYFVFWNALFAVIFSGSKYLVYAHYIKKKNATFYLKKTLICGLIYSACLLPLIIANALSHGWTGGYTNSNCSERMYVVAEAISVYAKENKNTLPSGTTMEEVYNKIKPYIKHDYLRTDKSICICPQEAVYERNPELYIWNPKLSGMSLSELKKLNSNEPLITCRQNHFADVKTRVYASYIVKNIEDPNYFPWLELITRKQEE